MSDILADTSKFKPLLSDPLKTTLHREQHLRNFLLSLKKDNTISEELYERLTPSGSRSGILYGLPKVHKANFLFRPILSVISTHSYNLSKFLVSILIPLLSSPFMISDTFSFFEELRASNLDTNNIFRASFDVNSLFTNVPLDETIDIIVNKAFENAILCHGFSVFQLRKLLCLAVKNGHFLFNNSLYEQVDDVAMGSPLGPLFANIFLAFHERSWLTNCPSRI